MGPYAKALSTGGEEKLTFHFFFARNSWPSYLNLKTTPISDLRIWLKYHWGLKVTNHQETVSYS